MIGVLALDVECDAIALASLLNGSARAFHPHISILPRFKADTVQWPDLTPMLGRSLCLAGPRGNDAGLNWYEALPDLTGYDWLVGAHAGLHAQLLPTIAPVQPEFWATGYRPHLTLGQNLSASAVACGKVSVLPGTVTVTAVSVSLYRIESDTPLIVSRQVIAEGFSCNTASS